MSDPNSDIGKLKRACNSQKCIRAGGKHNDLEDVGKDVYHHTFFEMLGNWSFGDYFKKEAIEMAWDLLTIVFKLPKERLFITYFGGCEKLNLPADLEAKKLWLEVGVPESQVLPFDMKDNFWEMGETGPCGPCSEIHFDRIGGRDAAPLVNMDDPDVLEIWNLVFMQYNREADQSLKVLPAQHIDTGMGLERLVSVLQDKRSNYDTDAFMPIFDSIQSVTGCRPYTGKVGAEDLDGVDMAYRVVADHIRTLTIAISDGGCPSNEGRGYVLRRILRRAIRYCHEKLGAKPGDFASLVDTVVLSMGDFYPELKKDPQSVKDILLEEETQFRKTLDRGISQFKKFAKLSESKVLKGEHAWRLYDTYGFPIDLTSLMAEEAGMTIDVAGYEEAQAISKEISKGGKDSSDKEKVELDVHLMSQLQGIEGTNDSFKYGKDDITAKVVALVSGQALVNEVSKGRIGVVLDKTCFYAEQGGQIYDTGTITIDGEAKFEVEDVQHYGSYVSHVGTLNYGTLKVGDEVVASYDETRRRPTRFNHTATHILNFALRSVLQTDIDQKGSLVAPDRLRFDFNLKQAMTSAQIKQVENILNDLIRRNEPVNTREIPLQEAKSIHGLRAVFGEVYCDPVRVLGVGTDFDKVLSQPDAEQWMDYSIELCGGTHVKSTGEIKAFCITQETSIAKGVRRIFAVTGETAQEAIKNGDRVLTQINSLSSPEDLKSLTSLIDETLMPYLVKLECRDKLKALKSAFDKAEKEKSQEESKKVCAQIEEMLDKDFIVAQFNVGSNTKALVNAIGVLKNANKSGFLYSFDGEKLVYYSTVSEADVEKGLKADEWLGVVSSKLGGKHGGRPAQAQGSATCENSDEVERLAFDFAKIALKK